MIGSRVKDNKTKFTEDACLEWLKNQLFPNGIKCSKCGKVTKHHKISKRHCYACDYCGNQVYPTAGTIFQKSTTPLKTWFDVIRKISDSKENISTKDIRREYGLTYKTAWRMVHMIKGILHENKSMDINQKKPSLINQAIQSLVDSNITARVYKGHGVKTDTNPSHIKSPAHDYNINEEERKIQQKRDRTARLLNLQILLWQYPQGVNVEELARKCSVSKRTAYRDLSSLESELRVPIWGEGKKRGIVPGYHLPPISFTPAEATNIFIAARLLDQFSPAYNSSINSLLMKLNSVVPMSLSKQIRDTLDYMEKKPKDNRITNNFDKLVQAWLSHHKVRITCPFLDDEEPVERIVEPYFIEPSNLADSSYLIGFCNRMKSICAFAISYIIGDVIIEPDTFEVPVEFNVYDYIAVGWGVHTNDKEIQIVKLHFKPNISKNILNIKIHSSQINEMQDDGSVIMTLKVRDTIQFFAWVLAWKDKVEVLEPETLRSQIRNFAKFLLNIY